MKEREAYELRIFILALVLSATTFSVTIGILITHVLSLQPQVSAAAGPTLTGTATPDGFPSSTITPSPNPIPSSSPTPLAVISGIIRYGDTQMIVPQVGVAAQWESGWLLANAQAGNYSLIGVGIGEYTARPWKNAERSPGAITSLDAAMIAQFVSAVIQFSPAQRMAADVSGNGEITTFDAALVQRYATGLSEARLAGVWKFLPASRIYQGVTEDVSGQDYQAVLMGDVSQNWTAPPSLPSPSPTVYPPF